MYVVCMVGVYFVLRSFVSNYRRVGTVIIKFIEAVPFLFGFAFGNDFSFGVTFFYNVLSVNYFVVLTRLFEGVVVGVGRVNYLHTFVLILLIALL